MVMQAIGFTNNKLTGWSVVEDAVSLDRDSTTGSLSTRWRVRGMLKPLM